MIMNTGRDVWNILLAIIGCWKKRSDNILFHPDATEFIAAKSYPVPAFDVSYYCRPLLCKTIPGPGLLWWPVGHVVSSIKSLVRKKRNSKSIIHFALHHIFFSRFIGHHMADQLANN